MVAAPRFKTRGLEAAVDDIVDAFTGADGGGRYALWLGLVAEMDRRALEGDDAARKVLDVVARFARTISAAARMT